jgi:hypothetical protein
MMKVQTRRTRVEITFHEDASFVVAIRRGSISPFYVTHSANRSRVAPPKARPAAQKSNGPGPNSGGTQSHRTNFAAKHQLCYEI